MYKAHIKRAIDLVGGLFLFLFLWPVLIFVAVLVRFRLGSPVLFKQERPGQHGKVFSLYKFRTMTDTRDAQGELLPDEVRLTAFGRWLRSTSLDELPELFNIIKGDMSFIGPRPLLVSYLPRYNAHQRQRHDVKPGLTGWAVANGRNALTWEEKFDLDVYYVHHLSFKLDCLTLLKTVAVVFKREGVSQDGFVTCSEFKGTPEKEDSDEA